MNFLIDRIDIEDQGVEGPTLDGDRQGRKGSVDGLDDRLTAREGEILSRRKVDQLVVVRIEAALYRQSRTGDGSRACVRDDVVVNLWMIASLHDVALAEPAANPIAPATAIEKTARFIGALRSETHTLMPATGLPIAEPFGQSQGACHKRASG